MAKSSIKIGKPFRSKKKEWNLYDRIVNKAHRVGYAKGYYAGTRRAKKAKKKKKS